MDNSGRLRNIMAEDLMTMEDLVNPVEVPEDIPPWKLKQFRNVDKGINRLARLKIAKRLKVDWSEYQIYRNL